MLAHETGKLAWHAQAQVPSSAPPPKTVQIFLVSKTPRVKMFFYERKQHVVIVLAKWDLEGSKMHLFHVSGIYHILCSASKSQFHSKFLHRIRFNGARPSKSVDFKREENLTDPNTKYNFQVTMSPARPGREEGAKLQLLSSKSYWL